MTDAILRSLSRCRVVRGLVVLAGCALFVSATAEAQCRPGSDDCGPGNVCIVCSRGPECAVAPAECCADSICGGGMVCMNCPGRTACAVPPAECCMSGVICGGGMRCLPNDRGQLRCAVPQAPLALPPANPPAGPPANPPGNPPQNQPPGNPPPAPPPPPSAPTPVPTAAAAPTPWPTPQGESMAGKIDMSAIKDPEMRRQLEESLAAIGDPQPGGTDAPASPPAHQPPPPMPTAAAPPPAPTVGSPPPAGGPPPAPPAASGPAPSSGGAQAVAGGALGSGEYPLKGSYQMKCYSMGTLPMSGSFDLTLKVPTVNGRLIHENQPHPAEGTVTAGGEIRVTAMDAIVMTGQVSLGTGGALTGSGEIKSESTMFGDSYSCAGTWSTN